MATKFNQDFVVEETNENQGAGEGQGVDRVCSALLGSVTRKINEINPLLCDPINLSLVEWGFPELVRRTQALECRGKTQKTFFPPKTVGGIGA